MTIAEEQVYYVRPVNGDDSNDGKSFSTAWKTWQNAVDELCFTGVSAGDRRNAALFLVNEGTAYTGPYSTNGTDTSLDYCFTDSGGEFTIRGMSADGNVYEDVFFDFDLSGFTYNNWLYGFGSGNMSSQTVLWQNIRWKDADRDTNSNPNWIMYTSYDSEFGQFRFKNCQWIDNKVDSGLIGFGNYSGYYYYNNCKFKGNQGFDSVRALISTGNYTVTNAGRGPNFDMRNCWFEGNATVSGSSYILMTQSLNGQGGLMENCVFLRNGYDSSSKLINLHASNEDTRDEISRCIFIGNEGRVLELEQAHYSDTDYGNSTYGRKIDGNVFVYNGQPLYFNGEPALKMTSFMNNIFWNNTTEDVPSYVSGGTGFGPNRVVDPKFVNGLSGDFRAYDDSPVWLYKNDTGTPVGGNFVQKASPVFVGDTGDLSLSSGNTGDVVTVSGRSFQKISDNPIVWRRV